jgi:hypothetical protein
VSHTYIETDVMTVPAYVAGMGQWANTTVPDDGDDRDAAADAVGLEALADRTTWLRHRVDYVQPYAANGATISNQKSFVVRKDIALSQTIANGGVGYSAPTVWTTPSAPFAIDAVLIQITGTATASADPSNVTLTLFCNGIALVVGITSTFAGGTTYTVDGTTTNKTLFGVSPTEWGGLLDGTLGGTGTDDVGAASRAGILTVFADGGTNGYWGKGVSLNVVHGGASARTLTIPLRLTIYGRLL